MAVKDAREVVVEVEPIVNTEVAAAELRNRLRNALDQGYECVLVSVGQVAYIDSVLLGAVVQAHLSAVRAGARVRVLNATKRFRELLAVTKLDRVLDVAD
jgi:anti-anti-sigma factor